MATITSISTGNPGSAGQLMTINGTALSTATRVNFGNKSAPATVVSSTQITCSIPSLCAGQYNINVTAGTSTTNSLPFFYAATPAVAAVTPTAGPASPGTITVSGSGFLNATGVTFGAIGAGTAVTVVNDSEITVTAPAHGAFTGCQDTVDVTVTTPGGTSTTSVTDQFVYFNAPAVTSLSPATGPAGTNVTVTGTCFDNVVNATFTPTAGGAAIPADSFTSASETQLIVVVPAGLTAGTTYDLQVITPGGTSAIVAGDVFTGA
ncbi:IPT/TIG domain-containing protein [Streptomyces sp. NPDC102462]|uniref:IPT/TIG domain-containing protein n=1 Tax=Streptomyces sp. NPDC102462 TaxID=3366178 RepID=UPI0038264954